MPTGKVKWYDAEKGFGFISDDDGSDVFLHANALPEGVATLKGGTRVEFSVAEGRRGTQALQVTLLEAAPTVTAGKREASRKSPEDLAPLVEDAIKLLDNASNALRRGRRPEKDHATKLAAVLRFLADQIDP
ncbi:cold shock domain-containing protein [Pedococcus bigeumensis]|uniref:cold-shock protein n=1 Tax=Pedococcus bigeumensis TaxID=433644 RepID=UPI002FE88B81